LRAQPRSFFIAVRKAILKKEFFSEKSFREFFRPEWDSAQTYRLIKKIKSFDSFPLRGKINKIVTLKELSLLDD
jgi:nuclear transport factor 2 (NTF2) superfamily protein